ncbi:hypothetical protein LCGC14_2673020 [marine sediment metagenome]|uniref:Uncharacterized protein n=1 Tax=marine sediment metagenome TaxID=412755 RepID=A0A0F9AB24_9ZZZZ
MLNEWSRLRLNCRKLIREILKPLGLWRRGMLNRTKEQVGNQEAEEAMIPKQGRMYPCKHCGLSRDGKSQPHNCLSALKAEVDRLEAIVGPLNRLRAEDGVEVSFWCDKPNDPDAPTSIVCVRADWTDAEKDFCAQDFCGETIAEALKDAEEARAIANQKAGKP